MAARRKRTSSGGSGEGAGRTTPGRGGSKQAGRRSGGKGPSRKGSTGKGRSSGGGKRRRAQPKLDDLDRRLLALLKKHFGHDGFRGRQREAIRAVMEGHDALLTSPTGSGKSLVYQLPALALDGMVLVVSPLIALMKDQVDGLKARGIRAEAVNSSVAPSTRARILKKALAGELDLLYVTPERFRSPSFQEIEKDLPIVRLAVDEAHCVSQWGHDFRPDYSRLHLYRERIGNPPTVAMTATATKRVAADIASALRLKEPLILRTGIERPNLFLASTRVHLAEEKVPLIAQRIRDIGGAGIVYSALIRDLEALHTELQRDGIKALVYHGKLSDRERRDMQERFMKSKDQVVLATNAFGMGVDKADIRFVLHAQVPRTLEQWTQEIGRAGRDGRASWCELVYFEEDLAIQQNFVEWANPSYEYLLGVYETLRSWGERVQAKDLDDLRDELLVKSRGDNRVSICLKWLEVLGVTEGSFDDHSLRVARPLETKDLPAFIKSGKKRDIDLKALLAMMQFAGDKRTCRRRLLARYFGLGDPGGRCGACDHCMKSEPWRKRHLSTRAANAARSRIAANQAAADAPLQRGDWVRYGRRLGQIVKVDGTGKGTRYTIESATDLNRRVVDPNRVRVAKVEDEGG